MRALTNFSFFANIPTRLKKRAPLAQLVEQRTVNPSVASSILAGGVFLCLRKNSFPSNKFKQLVFFTFKIIESSRKNIQRENSKLHFEFSLPLTLYPASISTQVFFANEKIFVAQKK